MRWLYLILIFVFTVIGGMIPLWYRRMNKNVMIYLLTFTGAFLLGITILHLIPETFHELGSRKAGIYILIGFLLQVFMQQWSKGMEHGHDYPDTGHGEHAHTHAHTHHAAAATAFSLVVGLSVHAFMAGLPLGFIYQDPSALPSLALGILLHKIPEAVTLMTMLMALRHGKKGNAGWLIAFALVTPLAAVIAYAINSKIYFMSSVLLYAIAIVAGAFLHIATTIFFESGTRHHEITSGKIVSMIIGLLLSGLTLLVS